MSNWLTEARNRLVAAGFSILDDVPFNGGSFKNVARRSRFELTKFGFCETFFVFAEFSTLNSNVMRSFSADAFRCAMQHKKIPLPCGLFESVFCFAIAATLAVDEATQQSVRNETPPRHWAAGEIPVVFDQVQGKLYYFERTPLWGAAYYAGFRGQIEQFLGEGAKS